MRVRQREPAGEAVGHRYARHPRRVGGPQSIRRIFEHETGGRVDVHALGGEQEQVRRRLDLLHIVACADRIEERHQLVPLEPGVYPCRRAARCHRQAERQLPRFVDALADAGEERLLPTQPPVLLAHEAGEGVAVKRRRQRRAQVRERVEAPLGAQRMLPVVHGQDDAVTRVHGFPDVEQGRLAVDDQPVEVEDHCGNGHGESGCRLQTTGCGHVWPKDRSPTLPPGWSLQPAACGGPI